MKHNAKEKERKGYQAYFNEQKLTCKSNNNYSILFEENIYFNQKMSLSGYILQMILHMFFFRHPFYLGQR